MKNRLKYGVWATVAAAATSCGGGSGSAETEAADTLRLPDTLRVATLYSPTSYFMFRDENMGFDYALVEEFTKEKGMALDLQVAPSLENALARLDSGEVDLVAYEVPMTAAYKRHVAYCGPESETWQVLVQPKSDTLIRDVTELVGRDIYVESNSKYSERIDNLNSELGGGIHVHNVDRDTLITEDLLAMVSQGEIPLTVVDSDIAQLNKTYFPRLDISVALSFKQKSAWAVAPEKKWLADSIDAWFGEETPKRHANAVYKRYFEMSKSTPTVLTFDLSKGKISPYDDLIKKYAKSIGWDWRLLASMGFVESRFNSDVVSWAGARGIMQIMPGTARANGVSPESLVDPETSLRVATKVIGALDKLLQPYVADKGKRTKFVVAAYNSGGAHIIDAINLAKKYGKDATQWDGQVEETLLMKANPEFYNDEVVKYGYFRGRQTTAYVGQVYSFYERAVKKIKE